MVHKSGPSFVDLRLRRFFDQSDQRAFTGWME